MKTKEFIKKTGLLFLLCTVLTANVGERSAYSDATQNELLLQDALRISEAMPSNKEYLYDEDGDSSDWLELVNIGTDPISLENCWLSDNGKKLWKWQLPAVSLNAGERLVVFCSGKDRKQGELHTNFALAKKGGEIYLNSPSGQPLDSVVYGEIEKDMSAVFLSEAGNVRAEPLITYQATPGFPETAEGYEAFLSSAEYHGVLTINEAVSHNSTFKLQNSKDYYDWIELKNTGKETITLSDYYLSDDDDDLFKSRLPDIELKEGELFLVFCSDNSNLSTNAAFHVDFAVGAKDRLYVTSVESGLSDRVYVHDVPPGGSIGRIDGRAGFWYFAQPTPGKENADGYRSISQPPIASVAQGVYSKTDSFLVELNGKGTIYYTLDGKSPDSSDQEYLGPIEVSSTTVLRAVCQEDDKLISLPATFSYILEDGDGLPVTSLVCDPKQMFGATGVYYGARALKAKADANVAFFDPDGIGFSSDCSVELHGARSRTTYQKKSFELKFAARYGGPLAYDLFGDGRITAFSSLLLRGGSVSRLDTLRDCLASKLVYEVCPELYPQNVRYTTVYINGKYYGIYAWREAYSETYFEDHTGHPAEHVEMKRAPLTGGEPWELFNYITTHNMKTAEEYESVCEKLDMESLAKWMALEAYFDNHDLGGNIRYVKTTQTGKWEIILYDLDYTCVNETASWDMMLSAYQLGPVCKALLANPDFRDLLLKICGDLHAQGLTTDRIQRLLEELLESLPDEAVQRDCARWNEDYSKWGLNLNALRRNLTTVRMESWLKGLQKLTLASDEQMKAYFSG